MKKYGGYSYTEIEEMYPFEMQIFFYMVAKELKDKASM